MLVASWSPPHDGPDGEFGHLGRGVAPKWPCPRAAAFCIADRAGGGARFGHSVPGASTIGAAVGASERAYVCVSTKPVRHLGLFDRETAAMASLLDQLRQLRADLTELIERDPEQEVTGQALPVIDAVISEGRNALPPESTLATQIVDVISAETIEAGEPLRAADALLVVGQLIAALADQPDEQLVEVDRRLLAALLELLPSSTGVMAFLRDYDFAAAFRWESVSPLERFVQEWDNAECRFHDSALERERAELLQAGDRFLWNLIKATGPEPGEPGEWQAVVDARYRDTFRLEGREADIRRVDEVNQMATNVYSQHQRLIETARRRLGL